MLTLYSYPALFGVAAIADLVPQRGCLHGENPTGIDAGIYRFIANIYLRHRHPAQEIRDRA